MMEKKRIAILFGGCSTEYGVSLQSAAAVIESIDIEKYEPILLGITRDGVWYRYGGPMQQIRDNTWMQHASCVPAVISPDRSTHGILVTENGHVVSVSIDAAFPVLHGKNGEDGTAQGLLEMAGIPCVGCGMLCSAICMDKDVAHRLVGGAGIKTPLSVVVRHMVPEAQLLNLTAALKYPLFVKPANAGSSFGITRVAEPDMLLRAVAAAFRHDGKVVIEEAVDGFEVGCAVLGDEAPVIGKVDEIELTDGFFDFDEKYTLKTSKIHMPARVDTETAELIKWTAAVIYRVLECRGFARVDMFLTPQGEIIFNEVNTIPGFTAHSRYPNMLKGIGMSFADIIDALIGMAVQP